jgi:FG-GAP-like repeat
MSGIPLVIAIALVSLTEATRSPDIRFRAEMVDPGASETAAVADINRDGRLDIVSGDSWYEAPAWTKHTFRELGFSSNYVDDMGDMPVDVDGDGFVDIVTVTWFAKKLSWFRNPGKASGPWTETVVHSGFNVEFAILADVDNDGKAQEIVAQENGTGQAWYAVENKAIVRHAVSDRSFGHGIGAGDVNKDGRTDILTPRGWLEAPADPRAGNWAYHPAWESANVPITVPAGAAVQLAKPGAPAPVAQLGFMHVLDVNGDGRNDVITAAGHDYGVFWFEQGADGSWTKRGIDSAWSQGHASALIDLNGDGRLDFVTGKRFMAHNGSDPGEREPLGLYWYEIRPQAGQGGGQGRPRVEWIRHLIDYGGRVGGGLQIPVVDLDGDGDLDLVCPGKSGLFIVRNLTKPGAERQSTRQDRGQENARP